MTAQAGRTADKAVLPGSPYVSLSAVRIPRSNRDRAPRRYRHSPFQRSRNQLSYRIAIVRRSATPGFTLQCSSRCQSVLSSTNPLGLAAGRLIHGRVVAVSIAVGIQDMTRWLRTHWVPSSYGTITVRSRCRCRRRRRLPSQRGSTLMSVSSQSVPVQSRNRLAGCRRLIHGGIAVSRRCRTSFIPGRRPDAVVVRISRRNRCRSHRNKPRLQRGSR